MPCNAGSGVLHPLYPWLSSLTKRKSLAFQGTPAGVVVHIPTIGAGGG